MSQPKHKPVPDEVLRELANLAQVPTDRYDVSSPYGFFSSGVRYYIEEVSTLKHLIIGGFDKKKGATLLSAARKLCAAIVALTKEEATLLEDLLREVLEYTPFSTIRRTQQVGMTRLSGLEAIAYELVLFFSLIMGAPHPRHPNELRGRRRQRGEPPGKLKHPLFQHFVCALLITTRRSGGRFTLEKNIRTGTLIDAIKLLTPYLPEGVVPKRLPSSTLQRLKTWCDQILIDHEDLEYGLNDLWVYSLYPRESSGPVATRNLSDKN